MLKTIKENHCVSCERCIGCQRRHDVEVPICSNCGDTLEVFGYVFEDEVYCRVCATEEITVNRIDDLLKERQREVQI